MEEEAHPPSAAAPDEPTDRSPSPPAGESSSGNWVIILGSYPHHSKRKALRRKAYLNRKGLKVWIADTDDYPNVRNGLWAVVMGPYSKTQARSSLRRARGYVRDAYVKSLY